MYEIFVFSVSQFSAPSPPFRARPRALTVSSVPAGMASRALSSKCVRFTSISQFGRQLWFIREASR